MTARSAGILWFKQVTNDDSFNAGIYGVKLGEMQQAGFPVPDGFIITSLAYFQFIKANKLIAKITPLLTTINFELPESVMQVANHIQKLILQAPIPEETIAIISQTYDTLSGTLKNAPVTLTFSPTGGKEQLSMHTLSHISGESNVLLKMKQAWASLFEPQALIERHTRHIDHFAAGVAVTVQQEIDGEKHGVMMTTDPVGTNKNHLIIEAIGNDGTLDHYAVDKNANKHELIEKHLDTEHLQLTELEIRELASLGKKLEKFLYFPQEVNWKLQNGTVYLLSTKPLQLHNTESEPSAIAIKLPLILKAIPGSRGIANGIVERINESKDLARITQGEILYISHNIPLSQSTIKKAAGLIVEQNSRVSPVILMAREYGIPAIITQTSAQEIIKQHMIVTIDGSKGWIYKGSHTQHTQNHTATKIYGSITDLNQDIASLANTDGILFEANESFVKDPVTSEEQFVSLYQSLQNRPIIYRMFDQKDETNHLLGLRGASSSLQQPELFHKELKLLQQIKKQTNNLSIMLPFVRNVSELVTIKNHLSDYGLFQSATCKLWISIQTPSNVHLFEEFIKVGIDGISIDSDILTTLFIGTDKNNSEASHTYDVLDPAVLSAMERVIKLSHQHGLTSSVHGHSVLHHQSLVEKLVKWGITNIIVTPDMVDQMKSQISAAEHKLIEY